MSKKQFIIVESIKRNHVVEVETELTDNEVNSILDEVGNIADSTNDVFDMLTDYDFSKISTTTNDVSIKFEIGPVEAVKENKPLEVLCKVVGDMAGRLTQGKIYKVIECDKKLDMYSIIDDEGDLCSYNSCRFEILN